MKASTWALVFSSCFFTLSLIAYALKAIA